MAGAVGAPCRSLCSAGILTATETTDSSLRLRDHGRTDTQSQWSLRSHSAHNNAVCNFIADTVDKTDTSAVVGIGNNALQ